MAGMHRTTVLTCIAWALAAACALAGEPPAAPPVLAKSVYQAGLLADGRLLCVTFDGTFNNLDLATDSAQPWAPSWSPAQDGWDSTGGSGFAWKLRVSPDGQHVALATAVGVTRPDPDGDYMDTAIAIILCDPSGANARCVALAEVTDGGPRLDFTRDSSRLFGPWFFTCPPTARGFHNYIANDYQAPDAAPMNYIDTATGSGGFQAGLPDFEFYLKAPDSDFFVFERLDEPGLAFACFTSPGVTGSFNPVDLIWQDYQWALPDALLINFEDGSQRLVAVDGTSHAAPDALWRCYVTLPDGTCLFSDDRGRSIKYGKVDWPTFTVDWYVERPDLARFAEPLSADGWPERINAWLPLRDSSGVVIIAPGEGDVVLARVGRAGAKP
jgi:hypothetical protein